MRTTERKVAYPHCDKHGNLIKVDYIEIKDKKLAEEKLCRLEDIEEEIGIDLITLFKALKNGVYEKDAYINKIKHTNIRGLEVHSLCAIALASVPECDYILEYKNYGKTWALTEEELL